MEIHDLIEQIIEQHHDAAHNNDNGMEFISKTFGITREEVGLVLRVVEGKIQRSAEAVASVNFSDLEGDVLTKSDIEHLEAMDLEKRISTMLQASFLAALGVGYKIGKEDTGIVWN